MGTCNQVTDMLVFQSSDKLVTKYIHSDNSETAIKTVSSCDTVINSDGSFSINEVERNKYSIFISCSVGCFMKCTFCYLTMKGVKYQKLKYEQVLHNAQQAISHQVQINPSLRDRYVKIGWMGMGDAVADPDMVRDVTMSLLQWVMSNGYALGLDGVDVSTVLPDVKSHWKSSFQTLDNLLYQFPYNPSNGNGRSRFRLFYSLHSADTVTRNELIPQSLLVRNAISELCLYSQNNKYNVIFHHMFINGVNDSPLELAELLYLIDDFNLCDYEFRFLRYNQCLTAKAFESEQFVELVKNVMQHHDNVKVQISAGTEIKSACGQFLTPYLSASTT